MSTRKPRDAELDGDLVDPSFGANATPEPAPVSRASQPNPQVLVGGGEREARAYVPPTALPSIAAPNPNDAGGKVAIASSVDPRRMPTVRLAPGRPRPPLAPGERPVPPEAMTPFVPGTSARPAPLPIDAAPRSQGVVPSQPRSVAPPVSSEPASTPAVVWILAVVLAGLVGAGAALWIRRNMTQAPPPATAPAPART